MQKQGVSIWKNKVDLQKATKVNFKVKIKITIEFLVENYYTTSNNLYI